MGLRHRWFGFDYRIVRVKKTSRRGTLLGTNALLSKVTLSEAYQRMQKTKGVKGGRLNVKM